MSSIHTFKSIGQPTFIGGQFIKGQIAKIYPHQQVDILLNGRTVHAKVQTPIQLHASYIFQVMNTHARVELKIIQKLSSATEQDTLPTSLYNQLDVKKNALSKQVIHFFLESRLPLTSQRLQNVLSLLQTSDDVEADLNAIKPLLRQNYPLSAGILKALRSAQEGRLADIFNQLNRHLPHESLQSLWSHWPALETKTRFSLKLLLEQLGYFDEALLKQRQGNQELPLSIKQMMLKWRQDPHLSSYVKEQAETLINRLNGWQMTGLSQREQDLFQWLTHFPIWWQHMFKDVTMFWQGRKTQAGTLDGDHCKVVFHLQLDHLNDVTVLLQSQNRYLSLSLYNDAVDFSERLDHWKPVLSRILQKYDYQLSSVKQIKASAVQKKDELLTPSQDWMDRHI